MSFLPVEAGRCGGWRYLRAVCVIVSSITPQDRRLGEVLSHRFCVEGPPVKRRLCAGASRSDEGSLERPAPTFAVCFDGRPIHSRLERAAAADEASDVGR
jgi:hypothetical protein